MNSPCFCRSAVQATPPMVMSTRRDWTLPSMPVKSVTSRLDLQAELVGDGVEDVAVEADDLVALIAVYGM